MAELSLVPDLERELDELYGLPLGGFVAARNDLAKRLRKAGQREDADAVAKLGKPTVSAWVLNQLARREPAGVKELVAAGAELVDAQRAALSGAGHEGFETASRARRAVVQELTAAAASVLAEAGHGSGAATLERVSSSLRAASVDAASRELLIAGRVEGDLEDTGFELLAGIGAAARPLAPARAQRAEGPSRAQLDGARQALREARKDEREARRRADRARRELESAQAALERLEAAARDAAAEAERASAAVDHAEEALERLRAGSV